MFVRGNSGYFFGIIVYLFEKMIMSLKNEYCGYP